MSWFSKLLGTDKALDTINTIAEGGLDLADNAFFTDQEKAKVELKRMSNFLDLQKIVAKQSSPTAISRRVIAWAVMFIVFLSFLVGAVLIGFDELVKLEHFMTLLDRLYIGQAFLAVLCFYYGAHVFGGKK